MIRQIKKRAAVIRKKSITFALPMTTWRLSFEVWSKSYHDGSVRAKKFAGTVYIGKLMVHPDYRHNGYGTKLIKEIEKYFPNKRYELFTSTRSKDNIRLYQSLRYKIFDSKTINYELQFVYMEKV